MTFQTYPHAAKRLADPLILLAKPETLEKPGSSSVGRRYARMVMVYAGARPRVGLSPVLPG
jgi:hypothetical protein